MRPRLWVLLGVALVLPGCSRNHELGSFPPRRAGTEGALGSPKGVGSTVSGGGVSATRKRVTGKEEPATLLAADRTQCIVTAGKFKETSIGEDVWCDWNTR